jgi:hypothetical protein
MAEQMQCPPGTVKWRLHSAKQQLKTILSEHFREKETANRADHELFKPKLVTEGGEK